MDPSCTYYDGKFWKASPTATDKNNFFHAAFGTRSNEEEAHFDKQAKFRRMRWATFLTYFENETMPRCLGNIIRKCWSVTDKYRHSSVEDKTQFENYVTDIVTTQRGVIVEEIPVLATLENIKITVLSNEIPDSVIVSHPSNEILGNYLNVEKSKEEVVLFLEGNIFFRLCVAEENFMSQYDQNDNVTLKTTNLLTGTSENSNNGLIRYDKGGSAGIKGVDYQIGILSVFLLNAIWKLKDWRLSTENKAAGKFDDVVLESPEGAVLLQAKHKEKKKRITLEELVSVNSKHDDFSLPKYFLSYEEIKTKFNVKSIIICTNASLDWRAFEFMTVRPVEPESMLYYGCAESKFYTLNDKLLPSLRRNVKTYYEINFKCKGTDETVITDEKLKDFLLHLQFYCDYPLKYDIAKVTKELCSFLKYSNKLNEQILASEISSKITEWFQQKNGVYLTEAYIKAMFCEIRRDKYWQMLDAYNVFFNKNGFQFQEPSRVFYVVAEGGCLLQEIKICDSLRDQKGNILCVTPDDDVETWRQVLEAFVFPQYTFLIVAWPKFSEERVVKDITDVLRNILDKHSYKKIIITAENQKLQLLNRSDCKILYDSVRFEDFSKDTQETILNKRNVIFQGDATCLKELLMPDDYGKVLKPEVLEKFIRNENIFVGAQLSGLDENIEPFYISRKFMRENPKHQNETQLQTLPEALLFRVEDKTVLISNIAGMGKTTVLTQLAVTIKTRNRHLWIIRVELNEYTAVLRDALAEKRETIDIKELLNSKEMTRLKNQLERDIFVLDKKIVLILDGVDEISPDYTKLVTKLLVQCQRDSNFAKIFISTRPHITAELEIALKTNSFNLLPFTKYDQVAFLSYYWTHNLKLNGSDSEKCENYAKALIMKMASWMKFYNQGKKHFAAIPLQIRMVAEIFQEDYVCTGETPEWKGCAEYLNGNKFEITLPEKMKVTRLYQMFIEKKRDVFIKKSNPRGNTTANQALMDQFEECLEYHRFLALEIILDKPKCEYFSCYKQNGKNFETYVLKIGMVQKLHDEFQFVHRTFAEYFVAESLVRELQLQNQSIDFQRYLIDEILLYSQFKTTRTFFDSFLQDVVDNLPPDLFQNYQALKDEINLSHRRRFSLIHRLAEEGCLATLQLLFKCIDYRIVRDKQVKVSDLYRCSPDGNIPLQSLGNTLDIITHLLRQGGVNIIDDRVTPLHLASAFGQLEMVKFLVNQGADVNITDFFQQTPLHLAVNYDHLEVVKFLVEQGADIRYRDGCDKYALLLEVLNKGKTSIAAYLMENIIGKDDLDANSTVAYTAAYLGKMNIVGILLERGLGVNCRIENGQTPLFGAAQGGQIDTIQFLIQHGAEINVTDKKGNTALHYAAEHGQSDIAAFLVKRGADVNITNVKNAAALHLACSKGRLSVVKGLLQHGADFITRAENGKTALHLAAEEGELDIINCLLELGVDIDLEDENGWTAMHSAVWCNRSDTVKLLVGQGADTDKRDHLGHMPFHLAAAQGRTKILKFLIDVCDADTNSVDEDGRTALHLAVQKEKLDTVEYLARHKVNVNCRDKYGRTALHHATSRGFVHILKFLVEFGADTNIGDNEGRTALDFAEVGNYSEISKFLRGLS